MTKQEIEEKEWHYPIVFDEDDLDPIWEDEDIRLLRQKKEQDVAPDWSGLT